MPPGLGVLRGPAALSQPEPWRERPHPACLARGQRLGLQLDVSCLCLGGSASGGINLLREDRIRILEDFFFFFLKEKLVILRHAFWLFTLMVAGFYCPDFFLLGNSG